MSPIFSADDELVQRRLLVGHPAGPQHGLAARIELGHRVGDDEYLGQLECRLAGILADFRADLVFYLAGVDIVQGDRYGRLALSDSGLRRRERRVLETCRNATLPVAITIAGGYAATPERTGELHAVVFEEAACLARAGRDAVPFRTPEYGVAHPTPATDT